MILPRSLFYFFFFNDTATTEIYTLSLHDALPISQPERALLQHRDVADAVLGGEVEGGRQSMTAAADDHHAVALARCRLRSEEHTSELQSQSNLVCRLLLEKKKTRLATCLSIPPRR